jgi:hypothetical protein
VKGLRSRGDLQPAIIGFHQCNRVPSGYLPFRGARKFFVPVLDLMQRRRRTAIAHLPTPGKAWMFRDAESLPSGCEKAELGHSTPFGGANMFHGDRRGVLEVVVEIDICLQCFLLRGAVQEVCRVSRISRDVDEVHHQGLPRDLCKRRKCLGKALGAGRRDNAHDAAAGHCIADIAGHLWGQCKPPGSTLQASEVRTSPIFLPVLLEASKSRDGLHIVP